MAERNFTRNATMRASRKSLADGLAVTLNGKDKALGRIWEVREGRSNAGEFSVCMTRGGGNCNNPNLDKRQGKYFVFRG